MIYIYIASLVLANLLVAHFGPWFSPVNAFFLIALDLVIRDELHERWKENLWPKMLGLIAVAGLVSYLLNPAAGKIAIASVVAFSGAMLVDAFVYQKLIKKGWLIKTNGSNAAGAITDSLLFPTIAFGGFLPHIVAMQFCAKFFGGLVWSLILRK
jgi:hypothetical protein